jgi:hypothetical protein
MPFKRRGEPATIEDEREALREQRVALEDLKRQLAERVEAVRDRELELHHALAEVSSPPPAGRPAAAQAPPVDRWEDQPRETTLAERERALGERERALVERERAAVSAEKVLAERERQLDVDRRAMRSGTEPDTGEDALEAERRERAFVEREQAIAASDVRLDERERELDSRALELADQDSELERRLADAAGATAASAPSPEQDEARLAQIEVRLAELRDAEKLFLRTRDELADRSEAVAARERLVAQKERELDDREDGVGQWASPELSEMEARLRRLEQGQPGEQTVGFSGGLRKLQEGTTRTGRDA